MIERVARVVIPSILLSLGVSTTSAAAETSPTPRLTTLGTLAQLRVATLTPRAGQVVTFSLEGSRVATGASLASGNVPFGDGQSAHLTRIVPSVNHTYAKPGVFRATLKLTDSAGHLSVVTRVVVVAGPNSLVFRPSTSRLAASYVSSYTPLSGQNVKLVLSSKVAVPKAGHVYLVPSTTRFPSGLIVVVASAARAPTGAVIISGHNGTLNNVYYGLKSAAATKLGSTVIAAPAVATTPGTLFRTNAVPLTCQTSGNRSVTVSADFSNTYISATVNVAAAVFSTSVISKPVFSLGVTFSGEAHCALANGASLYVPVAAVPGLVVTVSPYLTLDASGQIQATAQWYPQLFMTVQRAPNNNQNFFSYHSTASASVSASAAATVSAGISVCVSAARIVGLTLNLGPRLTVTGSASQTQFCIDVTTDIELKATLFANVFFATHTYTLYDGRFLPSVLLHHCVGTGGSASATGSAPPTQSASGGTLIPPTSVAPGTGRVVASPCLNFHTAAGVSAPQVGCIPVDTVIGIQCTVSSDSVTGPYGTEPTWDGTTYNGQQGYVADAWVYTGSNAPTEPACGSTSSSPPPPTSGTGTVIASPCLNFHNAPGIGAGLISCIPQNTQIPIQCVVASDAVTGPYGTETVWDQTSYGGQTGYVSDAWVYTGSNAAVAQSCSSSAPPPPTPTGQVVASPCLNLHNSPGIAATIVACIPDGTTIPIDCTIVSDAVSGPYGTESIWDRTTWNGTTGYVADAWVYTGTNSAVAGAC